MNKLELIEKLRRIDEVSLLELLDISSDDLIDNFLDKIDDRIEYLYKEVKED